MLDTKEKIIEAVVKSLPYPEQIKDWDMSSESDAIRFTWRGSRYKVSTSGHVEEVGNGVLIGSDICIVMRELIKKA